jgi:hypothetical protein
MVAILIEVGVEARDDRDFPTMGQPQRAQAESGFGGDVDQVGPERFNGPVNLAEGRQRDAHFAIERQGPGLDQVVVDPTLGLAVVRVDDLDRVARSLEVVDKLSERSRDPVDLGRVRLGDQGQSHGGTSTTMALIAAVWFHHNARPPLVQS